MATIKHEATKTFQKDGKWIERTRRSEILVCSCGTRYLKTRRNQSKCLFCMRIEAHKAARGAAQTPKRKR